MSHADRRASAHPGAHPGAHPEGAGDALLRLAEPPPPPRRTDAAFARAVAADVKRRRAPFMLVLGAPALALAATGIAIMVAGPGPGALTHDAGVLAPTVAAAQIDWGEDNDFAMPSLEGSTDEELVRLDQALDSALDHALQEPK